MKKALVVDDVEQFRRLISLVLQRRPEWQVIHASDGLEALQKAQELQPELIILDIGLPKINGIETARHVRSICPAAKVLFVSLESSADVVEEALRLGAMGYVNKMCMTSDLPPAIDAVLAGKYFVNHCTRDKESTVESLIAA